MLNLFVNCINLSCLVKMTSHRRNAFFTKPERIAVILKLLKALSLFSIVLVGIIGVNVIVIKMFNKNLHWL